MKVKLTQDQSVPAASTKLAISAVIGAVAGIFAGLAVAWKIAPLVAWDVAALAYVAITWGRVLDFGPDLAKRHALREDPSRVTSDLVLIAASLASLAGVAFVLIRGTASPAAEIGLAALGLVSVVVSWLTVHTVYALRYAELFYRDPGEPVDFGDTKTPVYADFAYLAFTLGMTFQVSDTVLKTSLFRRTALKHALLSYLFGTVIIATTINLVAGLGR